MEWKTWRWPDGSQKLLENSAREKRKNDACDNCTEATYRETWSQQQCWSVKWKRIEGTFLGLGRETEEEGCVWRPPEAVASTPLESRIVSARVTRKKETEELLACPVSPFFLPSNLPLQRENPDFVPSPSNIGQKYDSETIKVASRKIKALLIFPPNSPRAK